MKSIFLIIFTELLEIERFVIVQYLFTGFSIWCY